MGSIFDGGAIEMAGVRPLQSVATGRVASLEPEPRPCVLSVDEVPRFTNYPAKADYKRKGYGGVALAAKRKRQATLQERLEMMADWTTSKELADKLGKTRCVAQSAIRTLEDLGLLDFKSMGMGGGPKVVRAKPGAKVELDAL